MYQSNGNRFPLHPYGHVENIPVIDIQSFFGKSNRTISHEFLCKVDRSEEKQKQSFIHNSTKQTIHKHDICSVGFSFKGNFDVKQIWTLDTKLPVFQPRQHIPG